MVSFWDPEEQSFVAAVWEAISSKENHNQCLKFGAIVHHVWHLSRCL